MERKRTIAREHAMMVLYHWDLMKDSIEDSLVSIPDTFDDYTYHLIHGVEDRVEEIDSIISSQIENYSISRLNYVDRAIIRICVLELLEGLDSRIAINEAIELSKKYTLTDDFNSQAFNNKLLDKISKHLCQNKTIQA